MKKICLFIICCLIMLSIIPINNINILSRAEENEIDITSKSAVLYDANSKTIIYEKNADERLPIASMTKLASLMLIFEAVENGELKLDDKVLVSETAAGVEGSQAFLDAGSEYLVGDLIMTIVVASANDSTVALAEKSYSSEDEFVKKLNKEVKEMGLKNTHFNNATGLPTIDHYSSANDITKIYERICDNEIYKKYSKIWMTDLVHPSGRKTQIVNTNKMIRNYEGCESGKTGHTNEAGYCLSASAKRKEMRLIGCVIGANDSKTRFNEMKKLFDYGFANYENKVVLSKDVALCEAKVLNSKQDTVKVYPEKDFVKFLNKGEAFEYSLKQNINEIRAKKNNGDVVGKLYVLDKDNIVIFETNIVVRENIEPIKIGDILHKIYRVI